jgi:hypothetical protein
MNQTTKITIDKGVPIPSAGRGSGAPRMYPWHEMEPGDSFFVPGAKRDYNDKRPGVDRQFGIAIGKKLIPGSKWATRAVTENGINGVRVWRVS